MLVTFARHGDRIRFSRSDADSFEVSGPFAADLGEHGRSTGNLIVKARDILRSVCRNSGVDAPTVHIHLQKNLPVASGIGGGSADAASALRGLLRLWDTTLTPDALAGLALQLGADVPMCLYSRPLIARGIGEDIALLPAFPSFGMILGNPLVSVSTPAVFRRLQDKANPPFDFEPTKQRDADDWVSLVGGLRNDLEPPATALCGEIGVLSELLLAQEPRLVRMSGSGATCFALFDDLRAAEAAATSLHRLRPDWYFRATETIAGDP